MEFKNYVKVIKKQKTVVFVCIVLCALLALVFSMTRPESYDTKLSVNIHKVNRQDSQDFQYDNYYAIQAAELLSNTVVGWIESPDFVYEVFDRAEMTPQEDEIYKVTRGMKAKQISSHLVQVSFNQPDRDRSAKIANSLVDVLGDKVQQIELTPQDEFSFEIVASNPIISEKKYDPVLITLIGLVCGLFVGLGMAFLFEYIKED